MKTCIVIIPIYKKEFDENEENCVVRYFHVLQGEKIAFVGPEHLDTSYYEKKFPEGVIERFPDAFFKGILGYNKLMLSEKFYERFLSYDYMLIAQPDATILQNENRLQEFMALDYDYIGAPWDPARRIWEWSLAKKENGKGYRIRCCKKEGDGIVMGNGGFSLRKVIPCKNLVRAHGWRKIYWYIKRNEDIFFGVLGRDNRIGFKLADIETGFQFAREYQLKENLAKGNVPFGVHGYQKEFASYQEMDSYMKEVGKPLL